jgi:hypothetical protein
MSNNEKLATKSNLAKEIHARDLERKAIDTLEECLKAEVAICDKGAGVRILPDGKTRLNAALGILAYSAGRPIERKEIVQMTLDSTESYLDRIRKSPELRKKMAEMLADAEKKVVEVAKSKPANEVDK